MTRGLNSLRWLALSAGLVVASLAPEAAAHGTSATQGPPPASELPPGPLKRAILNAQQRARKAGRPAELIEQPIDQALRAAQRSRGAADAGDAPHASLLTRLAERWTKVASAVLDALDAEAEAEEEAKRLGELNTKIERAEALLAEQQARLGRLKDQVSKAEARVEANRKKRSAESAETASKKKAKKR